MQAEAIEETDDDANRYNAASTHWLSFLASVPTVNRYNVASSFKTNFSEKSTSHMEGSVQYTYVNENKKRGTFFFNCSGGVKYNNSISTENLESINESEYLKKGGVDTVSLESFDDDDMYVGTYKVFVTPVTKLQFTFFPNRFQKDWGYVGFNLMYEQQYGVFNPTNLKLGIPFRLNDSEGDPKINFELQMRTEDFTSQENSDSFLSKSSIGISVGLPFSSLIY
jgi:hypothetical protein